MIARMISMIMLLAIPTSMLGGEPGKLLYVFKPDIPENIQGIYIQFEVKLVKVSQQGKTINIYCLCADITNQNERIEKILVRYQCQGNAKSKKVEIGGRQQRIFLVDKCMMAEDYPSDIKKLYGLEMIEYRK